MNECIGQQSHFIQDFRDFDGIVDITNDRDALLWFHQTNGPRAFVIIVTGGFVRQEISAFLFLFQRLNLGIGYFDFFVELSVAIRSQIVWFLAQLDSDRFIGFIVDEEWP